MVRCFCSYRITSYNVCYTKLLRDDGQISVVLAGNIAGAEISWTSDIGFSDGPLDASVAANLSKTNLKPGNYTVIVDNNNGCPVTKVTPVTIDEPEAWVVSTSVTPVSSYGNTNGAVAVDFPPTGNTAPYAISWADDATITAWSRSGLASYNFV